MILKKCMFACHTEISVEAPTGGNFKSENEGKPLRIPWTGPWMVAEYWNILQYKSLEISVNKMNKPGARWNHLNPETGDGFSWSREITSTTRGRSRHGLLVSPVPGSSQSKQENGEKVAGKKNNVKVWGLGATSNFLFWCFLGGFLSHDW